MADNKFNNKDTIARCVPMGRLQSVIARHISAPITRIHMRIRSESQFPI